MRSYSYAKHSTDIYEYLSLILIKANFRILGYATHLTWNVNAMHKQSTEDVISQSKLLSWKITINYSSRNYLFEIAIDVRF